MEATAWNDGKRAYGIRVGLPNRRHFFNSDWSSIEIEIGGMMHTFALTGGFWRQCPEVRDRGEPVIRDWLNRHHTLDWPKGDPPRFELEPLGENRFRLMP